jgi:hypothetical protein
MGLISGPLSSISSRWAIAWPCSVWKEGFNFKKKKEKRFRDGNDVDHMRL